MPYLGPATRMKMHVVPFFMPWTVAWWSQYRPRSPQSQSRHWTWPRSRRWLNHWWLDSTRAWRICPGSLQLTIGSYPRSSTLSSSDFVLEFIGNGAKQLNKFIWNHMFNYSSRLEVGFYVQGVPGMNYRVFDDETQAEYAFNEALISDIVKVIPDCQLGHRLPVRDIPTPPGFHVLTFI